VSVTCETMRMLLYPYQDGSLSDDEQERVVAHLTVCDDCRDELLLIRSIDEALTAEPLIEPGRGFTKRVMARIPKEACGAIRALLYPYQDGSLTAPERERVAGHLRECSTCRNELLLIRSIDEALAAEPLIEPGRGFTKRVMARIPKEAWHPAVNWWVVLPWVGGYTVMAGIIYRIVTLFYQRQASIAGEAFAAKFLHVMKRFVEGVPTVEGLDTRILTLVQNITELVRQIDLHQFEMPLAMLTSFLIIFVVQRATDAVVGKVRVLR